MARLSKREWLEEALKLLAEVGASNLTIDALTTKMGITKGSFYHHFNNYHDFKVSLLDLFEEVGTLEIIRITEKADTPEGKLRALSQAMTNYPLNLELQIRAWAIQDEIVYAYQQRIDQRRMDYVQELYLALTHDAEKAEQAAKILYTFYIGSQQIIPPIAGEDLTGLYDLMQKIFIDQPE